MIRRRTCTVISRTSSSFIVGMTMTRVKSNLKKLINNGSRVNITGSKKKAIMIFTTKPTSEPFIRLDILGHRLNSQRDKDYCIMRLRTGRLVAVSINLRNFL